MEPNTASTYNLRAIIVTAFGMARAKGKEDWRRMTAAVLKNRLLQITHGTFKETDHGFTSLRDLLTALPDIVQFVDGCWELLEKHAPAVSVEERGARVRSDLWTAVMDFSSGRRYTWDDEAQRAREARPDEALVLPTLTREEFAKWRAEFCEGRSDAESLKPWRDGGLGSHELPASVAGEWYGFVKRRVAVLLEMWFAAQGVARPTVFVAPTILSPRHSRAADPSNNAIDEMRAVIHACVDVMTEPELSELRLSPSVLVRAKVPWNRS